MFFTANRHHFFRPLTGKYREQVAACLRALYARLYSAQADYSRAFNRDQVMEVLQEAVMRTAVLDDEGEDKTPSRSDREQANWILNLLIEHGWVERQLDEATHQTSYAFTRTGRLFAQPMVESSGSRFRSRHRNTRNTCNALHSFLSKEPLEIYDLLDAYEYSERIVSDFSDIIAELDERKRQLVTDIEAQNVVQRASDEFFDFMEKRFMPDVSIRLSADSIEKFRDDILDLVRKARRKSREFKAAAEKELRKAAPELVFERSSSVYFFILDGIESRVISASDVMLPALRRALHSFTRRADIIIRQLSFSGAQRNELLEACQALSKLNDAQYDAVLAKAAQHIATFNIGFVDPDSLRLHTGPRRRIVNTFVEHEIVDDPESRRDFYIQLAVERAFAINQKEIRAYLMKALQEGETIHTTQLPVSDARELLYASHIIGLGAAAPDADGRCIEVLPTGVRTSTEFFDAVDEFSIRLVEAE